MIADSDLVTLCMANAPSAGNGKLGAVGKPKCILRF